MARKGRMSRRLSPRQLESEYTNFEVHQEDLFRRAELSVNFVEQPIPLRKLGPLDIALR